MNQVQRNIILLGPKGVGKTTTGKGLSKILDRHFIDTDEQVERLHAQKSGQLMSCRQIYTNFGEIYFRGLEEEVIAHIDPKGSDIIALGGGAVSSLQSRVQLEDLGLLITLYLDRSTLKMRWDRDVPFYNEFDCVLDRTLNALRKLSTVWVDVNSAHLFDVLVRIINGK